MKSILFKLPKVPKFFSLLLVGVAALAGLLAAPNAAAQFRGETLSITNHVPATLTNSSPGSAVIDVSRVKDVAVQIVLKLMGAGTTAIPFTFQRSVDGSNYATAFTLSVTPAGTATATAMTNINTQAFPYWKISAIQNDNATGITNLVVTYGIKRNAD